MGSFNTSCMINCLLFGDDLVLLAFSEQGLQCGLDHFSDACDQAGVKTNTRNDGGTSLHRNACQCLQVSGNTHCSRSKT